MYITERSVTLWMFSDPVMTRIVTLLLRKRWKLFEQESAALLMMTIIVRVVKQAERRTAFTQ
jgi:hypothetical protein